MRAPLLLAAGLALAACGDNLEPPPRRVTFETTVGADGLSPALGVEIPADTRSVTIVVEGAATALYGLGALATGDGAELVALPAGDPGPAMQASYRDEQIGLMPGALYQSIRLGTFSHVYPYRPGQAVAPGPGMVRVASDTPGPVRVTIVMAEDDGAAVLPLNLVLVSDTLAEPSPAFVTELARIYGQAGLTVRIASVERITGSALERITGSSEPQEAPDSQSAMLPGLVAGRARDGLDVFLVESLPAGIGGLSLGTPGPPLRDTYYSGVIVRGGPSALELARVVAHEAAHFLALQHLRNVGISGMTYDDPLDDTVPGTDNLMASGTALTPHQAFALSRSPLLVAE